MGATSIWYLSCRAYKRGLKPVARLLKTVNFLVFHAVLPYQAKIHPDLNLEHNGLGVVVHPNVEIGKACRIYHGVTLAAESVVGSENKIFIGDGVVIGAGASVIGRGNQSLHIGDNARIGAGAVVTKDVPSGVTVVGIPARPITKREDSGDD